MEEGREEGFEAGCVGRSVAAVDVGVGGEGILKSGGVSWGREQWGTLWG